VGLGDLNVGFGDLYVGAVLIGAEGLCITAGLTGCTLEGLLLLIGSATADGAVLLLTLSMFSCVAFLATRVGLFISAPGTDLLLFIDDP